MAKIIIEIDNAIVANSIAAWFESGEALEAFEDSKQANNLGRLDIALPDSVDVTFDEHPHNPTHTINLY